MNVEKEQSISNFMFHGCSKHIDVRYHFIRDETKRGTIQVKYYKMEDMVADMMTKALYGNKFKKFRDMAGVRLLSEKECWTELCT